MSSQIPDPLRRPSRHVGQIFRRRRIDGGWSLLDVARADGRWTTSEVAELETQQSVSGEETVRYLRALRVLGGT